MEKLVHLSFTGVSVVSPAFAGEVTSPGPIRAIMPHSPRARRASNQQVQIDTQLAFVEFALRNLVQEDDTRHPDFEFGQVGKRRAICFLHDERLKPAEKPLDDGVAYEVNDPSFVSGIPSIASTHAGWIANWGEFAKGQNPALKTLSPAQQSYVELELGGGKISGAFRCDMPEIAKAQFLNGAEQSRYYAHETLVTLRYPASAQTFTLSSTPFGGQPATDLTFTWGDDDQIEILVGNGSLASIENVMRGVFCGRDHEAMTDYEFECLYDVVDCDPNPEGRLPVPRVNAREIRQIPCIISMIPSGSAATNRAAEPPQDGTRVRNFRGFGVRGDNVPSNITSQARYDRLDEGVVTPVTGDLFSLARASNRICRFTLNGRHLGTGFLIDADEVMTASHLFFNADGSLIDPARAADVMIEFDQIDIDSANRSLTLAD